MGGNLQKNDELLVSRPCVATVFFPVDHTMCCYCEKENNSQAQHTLISWQFGMMIL
jgi:hypothetical protein